MAHGDQRLTRLTARTAGAEHGLIDLAYPFDQPVLPLGQLLDPQIAAAQERHGGAPGGDPALPVVQRHQQALRLKPSLGVPADAAHQMQIEGPQQLVRGIQLGGGVVVAADEHHVQHRVFGPQPRQEAIELLPGAGGRIGGIEQIASHQQGIYLALIYGVGQPVEEGIVFEAALMAMELMAKVPVGCVQDLHEKAARHREGVPRAPNADRMRTRPPFFKRHPPTKRAAGSASAR